MQNTLKSFAGQLRQDAKAYREEMDALEKQLENYYYAYSRQKIADLQNPYAMYRELMEIKTGYTKEQIMSIYEGICDKWSRYVALTDTANKLEKTFHLSIDK